MTTVGYGDQVPVSFPGKVAGACCAMMGILCMSFPVPVFVSHFNYLYNLEKHECKLKPEELVYQELDYCSSEESVLYDILVKMYDSYNV